MINNFPNISIKNGIFYNGDCIEIMKQIENNSIDMVLCDLPYGTTQNEWDTIIPLNELWEQYWRICKENAAIVLTAQSPFDKKLGYSNNNFKYEWIWQKNIATGHLNAKKAPLKCHENILVFYKKQPTYNPQGLIKKCIPTIRKGKIHGSSNYGKYDKDAIQEYENYPKDILIFDSEKNTFHPTQKPVKLFEYLIKTYTNENEIVLDNTSGSGTTAIACENTKRKWICIEKDEKYYKLSIDRIKNNNTIDETYLNLNDLFSF